MKQIFAIMLILLLLVPVAAAQNNHLKLLAVSEQADGTYKGAVADLFVEIRPGTGRVFMDTFPLSKLDTQISTRFAKEIACQVSTRDCSKIDFFYTIRSPSAVITGPSAGAALATLTLATLEDFPVNDKVSITGTINSGGLIGPVSGIKEKIEAGAEAGLETILIPLGEGILEENNVTLNLTTYGRKLKVKVFEAIELEEAVYHITGKQLPQAPKNFSVGSDYIKRMKSLAQSLCERSTQLSTEAAEKVKNISALQFVSNMTSRGESAFNNEQYYAAASFCFGSSVRFNTLLLQASNISDEELIKEISQLSIEAANKKKQIPTYSTITDLETFALVLERVTESQQSLNDSLEALAKGDKNSALRDLAFARERLRSADSWSMFFGSGGRKITVGQKELENSCINKLAEAEERFQYVQLFIADSLQGTRKELNSAYSDLREKRFDVCLFKASRAKAEADSVLSAIGVSLSQLDRVLDQKQNAVRIAIAKQAGKGNFPLAGYSYFEYANSLRGFDPASALLFYEYALELSNLDLYFKEESKTYVPEEKNLAQGPLLLFLGGLILGLTIGLMINNKKTKPLALHKQAYRHARKR
ncbi:MAG: S16 family serine protease [Nanoarchaeota archaeon]